MDSFNNFEIWDYLNGNEVYKKYLSLDILEIPSEKELLNISMDFMPPNSLFILARASNEIRVGQKFDYLFSSNSIERPIKHSSILRYVSVNKSYEIEYIPSGYSAICLVDFLEGKPLCVENLRRNDAGKRDTVQGEYERITLCTEEMVNAISEAVKRFVFSI